MFFLFSSFSLSLAISRFIDTKNEYVIFPEFGFTQGGLFKVSFCGQNLTGSILILASNAQFSRIKSDLKDSANICSNPSQIAYYINYSPKTVAPLDRFEYVPKQTGTLYPIVFNCNRRTMTVFATYQNPNSFLDRRDKYIPYFSAYISVLYSCLVFLWLINMCFHPQFDILLSKLFAFSCALKAISLGFDASLWLEMSESGTASTQLVLIDEIFLVFSNSFLFSVNFMAAFGLSTIREKISFGEVLTAFSSSFWFFISRRMIKHTTDLLLSMLFGIICFIVMTSYIGKVSGATLFCENVMIYNRNNRQVKQKAKRAIMFGQTFVCVMVFLLLCMSYSTINGIRNSLLFVCEEAMVLLCIGVDFDWFLIRDEFSPPSDQVEISEEEAIDPEGIHLIEEPQETEIAFLTPQ